MRITGGKYRGRRIEPSGFKSRPTTDFAREALFNILSNRVDLEAAEVLDLFAGTGSISCEFASRDARLVHSVEKDLKHFQGILRIIEELGDDKIRPIRADVRSYIRACKSNYDIVFADPPFDLEWLAEIPDMILSSGIIKADGLFILEHPGTIDFSKHGTFAEHRRYGEVNFSFFKKN